ncbi:hypothetical protein NX059_000815 [Plenodomus lindquistii]|nr:hypothetical protein NX059_000815 [Plenodomus lindquistii]
MDTLDHTIVSVREWAEQLFTSTYEHIPGARNIEYQPRRIPESQTTSGSIVVGTSYNKAQRPIDIVAWRLGSDIAVGYIGKCKAGTETPRIKDAIDEDIEYYEPFCYILTARSRGAVSRFKTLIRYLFWIQGYPTAVGEDLSKFSSIFSEACEDITTGLLRKQRGFFRFEDDEECNLSNEDFLRHRISASGQSIENSPGRSKVIVFDSPSPSPSLSPRPSPPRALRYRNEIASRGPMPKQETCIPDEEQVSRSQPIQTYPANSESGKDDKQGDHEKQGVSQLRKKLFDSNIRLIIAEGLVRTAEQEAALWKNRYEELMHTIGGI